MKMYELPPWEDSPAAQLDCFRQLCGILRKELTDPPAMGDGCAYHILVRQHYDVLLMELASAAADHYCRAVEHYSQRWLTGKTPVLGALGLPFGRYSSEALEETVQDRLTASFEGWAAGEGYCALSRRDHRLTGDLNKSFAREMSRRSVLPVELDTLSTTELLPILAEAFQTEALPVLRCNLTAMSLGSIFDDSLRFAKISPIHRRKAYWAGRRRLQERLERDKPVLVSVMIRAMNSEALRKHYAEAVNGALSKAMDSRIEALEKQAAKPEEMNLFSMAKP